MPDIRHPHPTVSVAICTYNRAFSLTRTLESLTTLRVPGDINWEVLLVDNNSADDTRGVAERFADRLPLRYVFETEQGLSHARNRALSECHGDAVLFIDDDVLVEPGWLATYSQAFRNNDNLGYCGGPIRPHWPDGRPAWIRDESMPLISGLIGYYDLGAQERRYTDEDMHPFGANFALSRTLFENLSPFRTELGVVGATPGRGEEAEYFRRARKAGAQGVYLPGALCHHTVQTSHLGLVYLYRYGIQKGVADCLLSAGGISNRKPRPAVKFVVKGLIQLVGGRGDRFRQGIINMGIQHGIKRAAAQPVKGLWPPS